MTNKLPPSMTQRFLRLSTMLVALALLTGLSACGAHSNPLKADTEGDYLRVGHLKYQVQLTRQLNPADEEDSQYLQGLTPTELHLAPSQAWFGVWMRVENPSPEPRDPALSFTITDTQGNIYRPTVPAPGNPFAYRATTIPGLGLNPDLDSRAYNSPPQGALILFKVSIASYDNRPLTLAIDDPISGQIGRIDLDV